MNIVIVDDSQLVRERVAKRIAELPDMNVVGEAGNSIEAIEIVKTKMPDVIILDIKMPGDSGIEVLKKIKKEYPAVKIIMLTNFPFLQYKTKCLDYGADYFLDKSDEFDKVTDILVELGKRTSNEAN